MKNDRLGLLMIFATLAVIALTVAAIVFEQGRSHERQIRAQGIGLSRALSSLPFEQLAPRSGHPGLLQTLLGIQRSADFAYGLLVTAARRQARRSGGADHAGARRGDAARCRRLGRRPPAAVARRRRAASASSTAR